MEGVAGIAVAGQDRQRFCPASACRFLTFQHKVCRSFAEVDAAMGAVERRAGL